MSAPSNSVPRSIEEAERRRDTLTLEIQSIQAQLGDKERTDDRGKRLSPKQYWAWRTDATRVLNERLAEQRELKAWLRAQDRHTLTSENPAVRHLLNLFRLLEQLRADEVDFEPEETTLIADAGTYLRQVGAVT